MPKRTDIASILVIGSGPIIIGQACEFDYSGTQACRVLREDGYRVILANSNPATIMTDPDFADATYIEPLTLAVLTEIIVQEKPDALLPTLGGQTALNLAMELERAGVLARYGVEMIGANALAITTAEDRHEFKLAMLEIGMEVPRSGVARTMEEASSILVEIGLPVIIRPAFILGGRGMSIASSKEEFHSATEIGLDASPISEILIEESIAGWKEFELEVMRDRQDNQVIVCSIENIDPMGTHTGDSITVAPIQTLSDVEYQDMRDAAFACLRRVGVETGGSNVQFAVHPQSGRRVIIEMNPRVSRSSALASKATGFPIAKIAAKLAVGYTLDEIPNDITARDGIRSTPASFEPALDYVVTKIPRWVFEKFPGTSGRLGTSMQSVGEVMAIGRTFPESLQKAFRSLEQGTIGFDAGQRFDSLDDPQLLEACGVPTPDRLLQVEAALRRGIELTEIAEVSRIDPWFLDQMLLITEEHLALVETARQGRTLKDLSRAEWKRAKRLGFSDLQVGELFEVSEVTARAARKTAGVTTTFKTVDTCAAEFDAQTPYHYSSYEDESEVRPSARPKIIILGSGPNRIGQGIEFDYCCVHASFALGEAGFETIMVNCNPETVSTDYDTSDRLYFEPVTYEDVMNIVEAENPVGIIVSLGGQTPLKLANQLPQDLILGTPPSSIDAAEDREVWSSLCAKLEIPQPAGGTALDTPGAFAVVDRIGFPALVRPSYVLGGRAMEIVYDKSDLAQAMEVIAKSGSLGKEGGLSAQRPILIDRFLEDATEVDVDAIRDSAGECIIGGVMEHVEEAGVHSGDSACVLPPPNLDANTIGVLEKYTRKIAAALSVVGLINVQYAVKDGQVFVIEANPRASRTVPFVAKATGRPLAKIAARIMAGATLAEIRAEGRLPMEAATGHWSVKEAVLPFSRFPETDALLGPEMRSTGEVMGIDTSPGMAFVKSQLAAGARLELKGEIFLSLADRDKRAGIGVARLYADLGYTFSATEGTARVLEVEGLEVTTVLAKIIDGTIRPATGDGAASPLTAIDVIEQGAVWLVINTPRGQGARADGAYIRRAASQAEVPLITTLAAARALVAGLAEWQANELEVRSLQSTLEGAAGGPGRGQHG